MKTANILLILLLSFLSVSTQETIQYNSMNRIGSITYYNGVKVEYTYDELGNRLTKTATGFKIVTQPLEGATFCAGKYVDVDYTIDNVFNSGNVFTAQLSNSQGSFK